MPLYCIPESRQRFLDEWPASAALYLRPDGACPAEGEHFCNPALADVLETVCHASRLAGSREQGVRAGLDFFYRGDGAREMAEFSERRDGLLRRADLQAFETRFEEPVRARFGRATVYKCGPWSQGPVFLQLVRLLEGFDPASMGHNSPDYLHCWLECAKLAYADREQYYGDPDHVDVPLEALLADAYTALRRGLVDMARADLSLRPGDPRAGAALLDPALRVSMDGWGYGTVHVAAGDGQGNLAALTPSGGWIMGNEVVPALGYPLGTRLQTFYLREGHANAPAPGKRPRTTLSPSLAVSGGDQPWMMAFGTMGGDQQDQWTSQFFLNRVLFGHSVQEAIEAPKVTSDHFPGSFHPHGASPGLVKAEGRVPQAVTDELARRGHRVERQGDWSAGYICAVSRRADGALEAGADPRGNTTMVFPATALAW
jgi:gamma-glutamyltranspeptidase/glutathione hydrolase